MMKKENGLMPQTRMSPGDACFLFLPILHLFYFFAEKKSAFRVLTGEQTFKEGADAFEIQ